MFPTLLRLSTASPSPLTGDSSVCLGFALTSHIYGIVGGCKSSLSANGLILDSVVHPLFDRGTVCLIPHVPGDIFHTKATRYYDVEFLWCGTMARLVSMTSKLPRLPDDQTDALMENYNLLDVVRPISIGDRFPLFTRDPENRILTKRGMRMKRQTRRRRTKSTILRR